MPSTPTANAAIEDRAFFFTIASELFCQLAEDGRVLLANPAFRRQLGDRSGNTTTAPANLIEQACITEDNPRAGAGGADPGRLRAANSQTAGQGRLT